MKRDERKHGLWTASYSDERWGTGNHFDTREEAIAYAIGEGWSWTGQVHELGDDEVAASIVRTCGEADEHLAIQDEWCWLDDRLIADASDEAQRELHEFVVGWVARHKVRIPRWCVVDIERVPSDAAAASGGGGAS